MEGPGKGKGLGGKQSWSKGNRRRSRFYNVYVGRRTGVYCSWDECHMQVNGFSGASYKSFDSYEEAIQMWERHLRLVGNEESIHHHPVNGEGSSYGGGEGRVGEEVQTTETETLLAALVRAIKPLAKKACVEVCPSKVRGLSIKGGLHCTFIAETQGKQKSSYCAITEISAVIMEGGNDNIFNGEDLHGSGKECMGHSSQIQGLDFENDSILPKNGNESPLNALETANQEVRLLSDATKDVSAETHEHFNPMDPQQCMAVFLEEMRKRMQLFDELMKARMDVFDTAIAQTNQSVKMLELVVCENHNLNTMNSIKSVDEIEQQIMNHKELIEPSVLRHKECESAVETVVQEDPNPKPSDPIKVHFTTVVGETAAQINKKHKTPTPLKDLVIDVTDDDISIDLHDFALAEPDTDDELKGAPLASTLQPPRDKGKRLFDSRAHPTDNQQKTWKTVVSKPPSDPSNKRQESTLGTPTHSKVGNVSQKKVKVSSSGKGGRALGKARGAGIPKLYKTLFRPTSDMELSTKEAQVFAYIFGSALDLNEVLLSIGDILVTRGEFYCFLPGRAISAKMIKLVALKLSVMQHYYSGITTWCFPPNFAEEVITGNDLDFMLEKYARRWIHACDALKFCAVIHAIVSAPYFGANIHSCEEFCDWEMMDARGIPNCGNSDSSSVWVVDWMEMDDSFQPNLIGVLKDIHVRVKTPLALVMGPYNLFKRQTEAYALEKWNEFNYSITKLPLKLKFHFWKTLI
ncbi:hypothetical protein RIF29_30852 [Crotalaria pallida]|uniref:Ribonuclease H n=1 Tax=Crotalaria pallida TaxID=3830 RepID=A0AAN9EIQ8_CROPI